MTPPTRPPTDAAPAAIATALAPNPARRVPMLWRWIVSAAVLLCAAVSYRYFDQPLTRSMSGINATTRAWFSDFTEYGESQWYLLPSGSLVIVIVLLRSIRSPTAARWCAAGLALAAAVAAVIAPALGWARGEIAFTILFVLIALVLWMRGTRYAVWPFLMFIAVAGSGIVANIVKFICGRPRPTLLIESSAYGFEFFRHGYEYSSFPSGHATSAGAACVVLCLWWRKLWFVWVPVALLMCASRIITESHYLSDVLSGALLGSMTALFFRDLLARSGRLR